MTTKTKKNHKTLRNKLKKLTIITIILCTLILLSSPVIIFLNSKYKIVKTDDTKGELNSEKIDDIF